MRWQHEALKNLPKILQISADLETSHSEKAVFFLLCSKSFATELGAVSSYVY